MNEKHLWLSDCIQNPMEHSWKKASYGFKLFCENYEPQCSKLWTQEFFFLKRYEYHFNKHAHKCYVNLNFIG